MATEKRKRERDDEGPGGGGGEKGGGEYRSGGEVRTGLVPLSTGVKAVQYSVVDGLAMFEGDIVLGTVEEMEAITEAARNPDAGSELLPAGVIIPGAQFHWTNCVVPYTIDPALPNQQRVTDAIAHWQSRTNYRFVVRTTQPDWITFRPSTGCSSSVGRRGGQQFINLAAGCSLGNTIHEIGHAIGMWHEQSREDRDLFVRINWAKIQPGTSHNFNQHITDGDDVGPYDYGSIMHYPRNAFSIDGTDTITPINPPTATIGQRTALSAGDIAAANSLCTPVKIKEAPIDTIKERIKDVRLDTIKERIKDIRKDAIKDRKEPVLDPIKRFDPINPIGPIKRDTIDRLRQPVAVRGGGGAVGAPFAVAAPHQAPAAGGAGGGAGAVEDQILQVDQQLQELAAGLMQADANRDALQQQYDETLAVLNQLLDAHDPQGGR